MTVQQHWKKWQAKIFSAKNRPNLLFSLLIIGLVLGVVLVQSKYMQKQNKNHIRSSRISKKKTTPKPNINPNALKIGSNHNNQAEGYAYSAETVRQMMNNKQASAKQKLVFLTFDDGVDPNMTPKILDVLAQQHVHATFFLVGCNITDKVKPILQRQITEGHALGIHSFSHVYSLLYPNRVGNTQQIVSEVTRTQNALKDQLGQNFKTGVWRYPGGHLSWTGLEAADKQLAAQGIQWMDWNAAVGDAEPLATRPTTVASMLAFLDGSAKIATNPNVQVVLMHDISEKTVTLASLPQIIRYYKDRGYTFAVLK